VGLSELIQYLGTPQIAASKIPEENMVEVYQENQPSLKQGGSWLLPLNNGLITMEILCFVTMQIVELK